LPHSGLTARILNAVAYILRLHGLPHANLSQIIALYCTQGAKLCPLFQINHKSPQQFQIHSPNDAARVLPQPQFDTCIDEFRFQLSLRINSYPSPSAPLHRT
jgi:hypothetical protein